MSTKTKILLAAGLLAAIGAIAAVSAQGRYEGRHGSGMGPGTGGGMGDGMGPLGGDGDMRGKRGLFGRRDITQDDYDARTRERFARLDKNGDGVIDLAEIEAALSEGARGRMAGGMGGAPGERMLRMFDENKDGKVTREEFLTVVRRRFAEMDLNNDGKIDDNDLPPMLRGRGVLTGEGGPGMRGGRGGLGGGGMDRFREADANKDGIVTLDEALAAATKRFDSFDRNKDGAIDKVDFELMRKDMTDYRVKRFVHQFGADKDGKVTREQFYAKAKERFARLDWNNDGKISRDEMPGGGRRGMRGGEEGGERGGMRERMKGWFGRGEGGAPQPGGPGGPPPAPRN